MSHPTWALATPTACLQYGGRCLLLLCHVGCPLWRNLCFYFFAAFSLSFRGV